MVMKKQPIMSSDNPTGAAAAAGRSRTRYKGVRKRTWGKFVSEIRLPNCRDRIWLGSFDSAEKAARAFDAAMFCLRGPHSSFNFPHDPPFIAGAHSLSRSQIQAAAAKFANDHPPRGDDLSDIDCSGSDTQTESPSPSPSVSEGTMLLELEQSDLISDLDMDLLMTMGSGDYVSDFGFFSGFEDLAGDFYSPALTSPGGEFVGEEFLWNFLLEG